MHHSEIECFVFARRRGWKIVGIYIDRDCCPVCASTLNEIDEDVHRKICSFYNLREELTSEKEKKEIEEEENDEEEEDENDEEEEEENDGENEEEEEEERERKKTVDMEDDEEKGEQEDYDI